MTPNQLAAKLAGQPNADRVGKAFVRPLLRRHFARDVSQKGSSWNMTPQQVTIVTAAWKARQAGKSYDVTAAIKSSRKRSSSKPAPATADVA